MSTAYEALLARAKEKALISSTSATLSWDQETYMPPAAVAYRSQQLSYLAGKAHELWTDPKVGEWLGACESDSALQGDQLASTNIRQWRRSYDLATKLPKELVKELAETTAMARSVWVEARKKQDFSLFQPKLTHIVDLKRKCADLYGYEVSPYDALLDEYEPDARSAAITELFDRLEPEMTAIVAELAELSAAVPQHLLKGNYPIADQQAFNRRVAAAYGFDFEAGRIDTTTHPFCTDLGPQDVRLTTRYDETDFSSSLYGVMHEAGHGLYEQGLPDEHFGTPVGSYISLGIHESQSRFWENQIGRTLTFWQHWHPVACEHFPGLKSVTPEQIAAALNRVTRSFIRVEADECTYDLHIMLRYRIELELIEGRLATKDVPAYWNDSFERMMGLKVDNPANGCLQDIHWSLGGLGYFPTYTLGNLNAAQLYRTVSQDEGIAGDIAAGSYASVLNWLRTHVHSKGQQLTPDELIKEATGQLLSPDAHLAHLRAKAKLFDAAC